MMYEVGGIIGGPITHGIWDGWLTPIMIETPCCSRGRRWRCLRCRGAAGFWSLDCRRSHRWRALFGSINSKRSVDRDMRPFWCGWDMNRLDRSLPFFGSR